jgi:hypothetical protein
VRAPAHVGPLGHPARAELQRGGVGRVAADFDTQWSRLRRLDIGPQHPGVFIRRFARQARDVVLAADCALRDEMRSFCAYDLAAGE